MERRLPFPTFAKEWPESKNPQDFSFHKHTSYKLKKAILLHIHTSFYHHVVLFRNIHKKYSLLEKIHLEKPLLRLRKSIYTTFFCPLFPSVIIISAVVTKTIQLLMMLVKYAMLLHFFQLHHGTTHVHNIWHILILLTIIKDTL